MRISVFAHHILRADLILRKQLHKQIICAMEKAYLRHGENNDNFEFTFQYKNPDLRVDRQFNFCRQLAEPTRSFLDRVKANVEKVVAKKKKKKKSEPETLNALEICPALLVDNVEVNGDIRCGELFKPGNNVLLRLIDRDYLIVINSPWIETLTLPNSILASFPVYPSKFESVYTDKKLSEFIWFKSVNKKEWIQTGQGFVYLPSNEDINHYLKLNCIPKNEVSEGPLVEVISDVSVQASPGECPFDLRHVYTKSRATGKE